MRIQTFVLGFGTVCVLGGCTVLPSVEYRAIVDGSSMEGMTDSFYRNQSRLEVSIQPTGELIVVSKPTDFKAQKLGIRGILDWRSSTIVTITKTPNSDRVSAIGSEVTDNTAKAITDYGGALVKLVALGAAGGPKTAPCLVPGGIVTIDLPQAQRYDGSNKVVGCIEVKLDPMPLDAIPYTNIPKGSTHNYYYSACRDATVVVYDGTSVIASHTVRIADPSMVQSVQFPVKGSITMHSECGVSVVTQSNGADNGAAVVNALAVQAKALKDAFDAGSAKK